MVDSTETSSLKLPINNDRDLPLIRKRVRQLTETLGFGHIIQIQITTAVSEMVRNVIRYGGEGEVNATGMKEGILIEIWDDGPGIPFETLTQLEEGTYESSTGLGKGIIGAKRLMDEFSLTSLPGMTQVYMRKFLK